jgi:hypothetical protein
VRFAQAGHRSRCVSRRVVRQRQCIHPGWLRPAAAAGSGPAGRTRWSPARCGAQSGFWRTFAGLRTRSRRRHGQRYIRPEPHYLDPSCGARCPAPARQWSTVVLAGREWPAVTRMPGRPRRVSHAADTRLPACWHPGRRAIGHVGGIRCRPGRRRPRARRARRGRRRAWWRSPGRSGPSGARHGPATLSVTGPDDRPFARMCGSGHLAWPD